MAYAQIRLRRISMGDIDSTEKHNARRYDIAECPENIDSNWSADNLTDFDSDEWEKIPLKQIIQQREAQIGVKAIKANSTHAIEVVLSVSDRKFFEGHNSYDPRGFMSNEWKWLEEKFGQGNVLAAYLHMDESKPHVHFIVLPVREKEVRFKNRYGEGTKKEWRLSASDYVDGEDKLSYWQQIYFEHCRDRYGHLMEFWRGTKAEKQKTQYVLQTDHVLGHIRKQLEYAQEVQDQDKVEELAKKLENESKTRMQNIQELDRIIEKQSRSRKPEKGYDWTKSWKLAEPGWQKEKTQKKNQKGRRR